MEEAKPNEVNPEKVRYIKFRPVNMGRRKEKEKSGQIKQMRRYAIRIAKRFVGGRRLNRNEIATIHESVEARINAG